MRPPDAGPGRHDGPRRAELWRGAVPPSGNGQDLKRSWDGFPIDVDEAFQGTAGSWLSAAVPRMLRLFPRWMPRAAVLLIVFLAVDQRFTRITEWPLQFHPTLQYENALTTRWIWFHLRSEPLSSHEQRWLDGWHGRLKAPPVLELLTALTYLPDNRERPWVASVFTSLFWLLGGLVLLDLTRRLGRGPVGTMSTLSFYLLAPFAIVLSRSVQHEALLTLMFLVALWTLVWFEPVATWRSTVLSGVACGMCALAKPGIVLLPLLAAYAALRVQDVGMRRTVSSPKAWLFGVLTVAPSLGYARIFLPGESHQLLPHLLLHEGSYQWWAWNMNRVIGWAPLSLGVAGAVIMALRQRRFLGLGLFVGYVGYALVFSYANMTHDYYLVPLLVITALCLGAALDAVVSIITRMGIPAAMTQAVALIALCASAILTVGTATVLPPSERVEQARRDREIGAAVGAGSRVLSLSDSYGFALMYHGWLVTHWWPTTWDKSYESLRDGRVIPDEVRFRQNVAQLRPSHFVITEVEALAAQRELARLLEEGYCVQFRSRDAIVYDLRTRCVAGAPVRAASYLADAHAAERSAIGP